jgi:hypothetical protein
MKKAPREKVVGEAHHSYERFSENMPVVALPPSSTKRWWLDYTVNGDSHSILMRADAGQSAAQVSGVFSTLLTGFGDANLYQYDVTGLRYAEVGSDVSLPAPYTGDAQFGTGTAVSTDQRAKTLSFTGRDVAGHKVKFFMYGIKMQAQGDYRISIGEDVAIGAAITYLTNLTEHFWTIAGLQPIWNGYANVGWNDHWIKRARG